MPCEKRLQAVLEASNNGGREWARNRFEKEGGGAGVRGS